MLFPKRDMRWEHSILNTHANQLGPESRAEEGGEGDAQWSCDPDGSRLTTARREPASTVGFGMTINQSQGQTRQKVGRRWACLCPSTCAPMGSFVQGWCQEQDLHINGERRQARP